MKQYIKSNCMLCGEKKAILITDKVRFDIEKPIHQCSSCELIYMYPPFCTDEDSSFYENDYRKFYQAPAAAEFYQSQIKENIKRFSRVKLKPDKNLKILEIGSAAGNFLSILKQNGYKNIEGVEIDKEYSNFSKMKLGLNVHTESLETLNFPENSFDYIICFHVLEHFSNPNAFLNEVHKLLKPGGTFIAEVPNVNEYLLSVIKLKSYKDFYYQLAHNFYFSPKTFLKILELSKYSTIKINYIQRHTFLNGLNWIRKNKPTGIYGQNKPVLWLSLINFFFVLILSAFQVTDTMIAYAKK